jgi:predicted pyridoxine 5'-phosphate oxidase superfamily flavin-nucleotide-binding protein
MKLSPEIIEMVTSSDSKALATMGSFGINVVPVSTIRVVNDNILLMNYFLKKTLGNIAENPNVALACWKGLVGCQIKGSVRYVDTGPEFEEAKDWVTKNVANRTLKGLLVLKPEETFVVSPPATPSTNG